MRVFLAIAAYGAFAALNGAIAADAAPDGAKVYQRCAACHLPTGAGVPGAFPPLAGRVNGFAQQDAGRDFLVMTVSAGLMGEIDIDGKKIRGFMPAQAGLSDSDVAAVLNYASSLKAPGETNAAEHKAFTAEEIAKIRERHKGATPNSVHAIRSQAFSAAQEAPSNVVSEVAPPAASSESDSEK